MKIYLAHSKKDYGNDYEKEIIKRIKEIFGDEHEYINPSELENSEELENYICSQASSYGKFLMEMEYFFSIIKGCDKLIAFPYSKSGNYTSGMKKEIEYAEDMGIRVEHIDEFCINKENYLINIKNRTPKYIESIESRTVTSYDILSVGIKLLGNELLLRIDSSCSQISYHINNVDISSFPTYDFFDIVLHNIDETDKFIKILNSLQNIESQGDGGDGGYTTFPLKDLSKLNCSFFINYEFVGRSDKDVLTIIAKGTSEPTSLQSCINFATLETKKQVLEKKIFIGIDEVRNKNFYVLVEEYEKIRHKILDYDLYYELFYL